MTTAVIAHHSLEEVIKPLSDMKSFVESQNHTDWTVFNQSKKMFLDLFKIIPSSPEKQKVWKDFTEVADSARAIRKIQEEEGEFAAEMIAQALDSFEADLSTISFQSVSHILFDKVQSFKHVKDELAQSLGHLKALNTKADQIQSLRDELSKTGMRLSVKGRLFDRLSKLGDAVFPLKKSLNIKVNELFKEGLNAFCRFSEKHDDGVELLFQIRLIQSFLKEMTLKKSDYEQIKAVIDPVWKKAVILKDKKESLMKEMTQKSEILKKSFEESFEQMKQLVSEAKDQDALKIYDELSLKLKDKQLLKNDFKSLKTELEGLSKPLFDRIKEMKDQKRQEQAQKASLLDEKKNALIATLSTSEAINDKKMALDELLSLNLMPNEVYKLKYIYFKSVAEKSTDQGELEDVYFEVKKLQESLRSQLGASSLDFAVCMSLQEIWDDVKELLNELVNKFE